MDNGGAQTQKSGGGYGVVAFIVIALILWWVFIRVDYKDVWWSGTEYQKVIYCGAVGQSDCRNGSSYYLPVTHIEKAGDSHTFKIKFDNGGYIETYGSCMKDESDLYASVERYCFTTTTSPNSGQYYNYLIAK